MAPASMSAEIAAPAEIAAITITTAAPGSRAAEFTALRLRCGNGWGGCKTAARARTVETVTAWRRAQYPAGARIGVEPFDPSVGPHPFEMIMFRASGAGGGTIGVVKLAGMRAAHLGQDTVQRLHARSAVFRNPSLGQRR